MKFFNIILLTSLISVTALSHAGELECPDTDLRSAVLGKPRNQGDSGWCFAYAAADMMSLELGQKISASDIAINYLASFKGIDVEFSRWLHHVSDDSSGFTMKAITAMENEGFCLEKKMSSSPNAFREYLLLRSRDSSKHPFALNWANRCYRAKVSCAADSSLFKDSNFCALFLIASNQNFFSNKDFDQYRANSCGKRIEYPNNLDIQSKNKSDPLLMSSLKSTLQSGKIVAISYHNDIWKHPEDSHASLVVGSRRVHGTCQFLVRGSEGPTCKGVNPKYQCDKKDPGNVWIKEEDLKALLEDITYIPKK